MMKTNDIHRKMLSVSKNLLTEHNLDFSWYINDYHGVGGYLHNGKLPNLIASVYLTEKTIEMCSVKMLTNDLQYEYACELLKEFKVKIVDYWLKLWYNKEEDKERNNKNETNWLIITTWLQWLCRNYGSKHNKRIALLCQRFI